MITNEKQIVFDEFMNEFVKLSIEQKNVEIIEKMYLMLVQLINFAKERNIEFDFLTSKEILDIEGYKGSHEDYLEAMMVYTHNLEEIIGKILASYKE